MQALQIIDEQQSFSEENLGEILKKSTENALRIVSILGPQSSGKSTLLNGIFDSNFTVMGRHSRQQTTRGIWASYARSNSTLILDVEGTDGRERGEDQDFERKSALFSLAISDVLIINLWENAVGLYHAANMSLLRTVMEVRQHLVSDRSHPTILLFVIRDFAGVTSKENIEAVLLGDLQQLWSAIHIPQADDGEKRLESSFDVRFEFLPHKLLQSTEFEVELERLKGKFNGPSFSSFDTEERTLPAGDLVRLAAGIWQKILASKDLHLPTERELVAQYRCEEILQEVLRAQIQALKPLWQNIALGVVIPNLGQKLDAIYGSGGEEFSSKSQRYPKKISQEKLEELACHSVENFSKLVRQQISVFFDEMKSAFSKDVLSTTLDAGVTFGEKLRRASEHWLGDGKDAIHHSTPSMATGLVDELIAELKALEADLAERLREQEAERLSKKLLRKIEELYRKLIKTIQTPGTPLREALSSFIQQCCRANDEYARSLEKDLGFDAKGLAQAKMESEGELCRQVEDLLSSAFGLARLIEQLTQRFEHAFSYDESGLPRIWTSELEVERIFKEARQEVFGELDTLNNFSAFTDPMQGTIFASLTGSMKKATPQETEIENAQNTMDKYFQRRFLEAKRSAVASQTKIPPWIFLLLLALGWNELLAVLSSPIRVFCLVLLGGLGYIVMTLNLLPYIKRWAFSMLSSGAPGGISHPKSE